MTPSRNLTLVVCTFICVSITLSSQAAASGAKNKSVTTIAPRIKAVRFKSRILGTEKTFCVVLAPDFEKQKAGDRPFLLLLHGSGRHERTLIDNPVTQQMLLDSGLTIVLPDGDSAWYVDSPVNPKAKYASYTEEVLRLAESRYKLSHDPKKRAITGWSMGGYGSVRFAETHPKEFCTLTSMIGVIDYPRASEEFPPGQSYRLRKDCFGSDPEVWEKHNPIRYAEKLRGMSILLITGDIAFDRTMNQNFSKELDRLKIPHQLEILKGGHTPATVEKALPLAIEHTKAGLGL